MQKPKTAASLSPVKEDTRRWVSIALGLGAAGVYFAGFFPPYLRPEDMSVVLLAVPAVLTAAWLFGFWAGLLTAAVSFPLSILLLKLQGQPPLTVIAEPGALQNYILLLVLGAVLGGLRDVGEQMKREMASRRRVEAARAESEERYEVVAESASDAILTLDEEARIRFANRAAEKTFGYSRTELLGQPFGLLLPAEDQETGGSVLDEYLDGAMARPETRTLELTGVHRKGTPIYLDISFGAHHSEGRRVFTAIVRDVTQRKEVETALRQAKEDAERANRAKSEFLSRMSHELRTPLNAILGFGQLLEMDQMESDEQRESVDQIMKAGHHLLALVDEVLDIAKIEAGRLSLTMGPVEVSPVIDEAWDLVRPRAMQRGIERAGNAGEAPHYVKADRQRLKQVMLNLLSNAVKYTPEGRTVRVDCEKRNNNLRILVSDDGDGIPREKQKLLFKPFERLDAGKTAIEGTGIGLALSKGLMTAMGGSIGLESEPGTGSTFWVELPLESTGSPSRPALDCSSTDSRSDAASRHGRTVLYIEDDLSNYELVRRILERKSGIRLLAAAMQGGLGLELAAEHLPDLILLDLNLPDMPGDKVLQSLNADPTVSHIPVVVISADAMSGQRQQLLDAGATAFLTKPLDVEQFIATIDQILQTGEGPDGR